MAVTHSDAVRNTVCNAVVDSIDGGAGDANGDMQLLTAGDVEVAKLEFGNPAFGAAGTPGAGQATANTMAADNAATGGVAAKFAWRNRANAICVQGSVGLSGADVNSATGVTIAPGDIVSIADGDLIYSAMP